MDNQIEAIFFKMSGPLRRTVERDDEGRKEGIRQIMALLDADASPDIYMHLLSSRAEAYKHWTEDTSTELSEEEIWTRWMLPDWPSERIKNLAFQLNRIWREVTGTREIVPETREVLSELFRRGYHLGVVSNTTSSTEIPQVLRELNLSGCVETVILSCVVGRRKPSPSLLVVAASSVGISHDRCAYVGNRPDRDVAASRHAGFSKAIIMLNPSKVYPTQDDPSLTPDHSIANLKELLDIFPPRYPQESSQQTGRKGKFPDRENPAWDVSLSSMWANGNFPKLEDFFIAARRYGFFQIELNHQVNSAMLAGIKLDNYRFSSIHEPCPADIPAGELIARDWLISATDEDCRRQGVATTKRSIDLANQLGAGVVVVHAGNAGKDPVLEKELRALFETGQTQSPEYDGNKNHLIAIRTSLVEPRLEAVRKSLKELLKYASRFGIRLGLENRYHYMDIPGLDELDTLLELAGPDQLGFVYDVGHAYTLDRLGFFPHEEWLRRYASRLIVVHLHDVIGIKDHIAPGLGDVNFKRVAAYLPEKTIRVCEPMASVASGQIKASVRFLSQKGCIRSL